MIDKYEGFVYPPQPRENGDRLHEAEQEVRALLQVMALTSLISCWTKSDHESSLMWDAYAGAEGVAVRTTFQDLQSAIRSVQPELPVTFGQVEYVDFRQREVPRFGWGPLFHKRIEYRGEDEVRVVLPGPPIIGSQSGKPLGLDPDVDEQRGRHIPVCLGILVKEVVLSPHAPAGLDQLVKSAVRRAGIAACVIPSALTLPPMGLKEGVREG